MIAYILSFFIYFITHAYTFPLFFYLYLYPSLARFHHFDILKIHTYIRFHLPICIRNVQLYFAIGHVPHLSFDNEILDTLTHWVKFTRAKCVYVTYVSVCVCMCWCLNMCVYECLRTNTLWFIKSVIFYYSALYFGATHF